MIVASIDLMDGKAVQLQQGSRKLIERDDVLDLARRFGRVGTVAVVDLDAAFGRGDNGDVIRALCRTASCRVGGGLRDADRALAMLRAGAEEVVIGTAASEEVLRKLPRERTFVAIDARGEYVTANAWRSDTQETPLDRARRLESLCAGFLYTRVELEGMMGGFDGATARRLRASTANRLVVAGGITSVAEVVDLDRNGIDAQVGMALFAGVLDEVEAFVASVDFARMDGLVPTVVCEERNGRPRMLAYSTPESLRLALREGAGIYWSRSRQSIWRKGEGSGNVQELVRANVDCDRDALVFTVRQRGPTCHTGAERCFDSAAFDWPALSGRIDARLASGAAGSYTVKLANDQALLDAKIAEEAQEVIEAQTPAELAWECADLLYFMTVKLRSRGLVLEDVFAQLAARAT